MTLTLDIELPADLDRFRLPEAVNARLQSLLDRQDGGQPLKPEERAKAEGLVDLAEFLSLLRLRAERLIKSKRDIHGYFFGNGIRTDDTLDGLFL